MTTLDDPRPVIDESSVPFFPTALRYGLIGGLISIVFGLIANMTGLSMPTSIMKGLLMMVMGLAITIGIGYVTIKHHRENELGSYITFGRAFLVGFVALAIASVLSALFNVLYVTVINPDFTSEMMDAMAQMFEGMGLPEAEVEKQLEATKGKFTPSGMLTQGLLYGVGFSAFISLIQGAIMKNNAPAA